MMTGKERLCTALNHAEPDRIPYDLGATTVTTITKKAYTNAMQLRGLRPEFNELEIDPISQIVSPSEENLRYLKADARRIGAQRIVGYPASKRMNGAIEQVTDFYGCDWELDPSKDLYFNQKTYPLAAYPTLSEGVDKLYRPDWDDFKNRLWQHLSLQFEQVGDFACVADRHVAGLTENSLRIRGYENWYMDTYIDLKGVEDLLEILTEDKLRYWEAVIDWAFENGKENQIDVISECDDLGSQTSTIIEPDTLRKIVIPRFARIFGYVKKRLPHVKTFMHSCGAIRPLIPDLIEAGLDILNPVQFTATGMELTALKKDFGNDIVFWGGGIDTQSVLNNATPDEVKDSVRRIMDIMAPGGGFVFASIHNVQDDVPPENFWAMWDTLQEYGTY